MPHLAARGAFIVIAEYQPAPASGRRHSAAPPPPPARPSGRAADADIDGPHWWWESVVSITPRHIPVGDQFSLSRRPCGYWRSTVRGAGRSITRAVISPGFTPPGQRAMALILSPGSASQIDQPLLVAGTDRDLVHIGVGRIQAWCRAPPIAITASRIRHGLCGQGGGLPAGSRPRISIDRPPWPTFSPMNQQLGASSRLAFADHHRAVDRQAR